MRPIFWRVIAGVVIIALPGAGAIAGFAAGSIALCAAGAATGAAVGYIISANIENQIRSADQRIADEQISNFMKEINDLRADKNKEINEKSELKITKGVLRKSPENVTDMLPKHTLYQTAPYADLCR